MPSLNIVLLEPRIPDNTGNIARTCAATGARLHLIEPLGFELTDKKLKRAGLDYWKHLDVTLYSCWEDFCAKNSGNLYYFTTKATHTYAEVSYPHNCYLVFGREDAGLPESLLVKNKDTCLRIPMIGGIRSLNLSNSVAIVTYELLRQWDFPELQNFGTLSQYNWDE